MKKNICIIGLGRFGVSLAKSLASKNVDIIAIDKDEKAVLEVSDFATHAFVLDSTDESALKEIGVQNCDHVVISLGQNRKDSIVVTICTCIALNNIGIENITVRVDDPYYIPVLNKMGLHKIVTPFDIAAERLANTLSSDNVMDYYNVAEGYNVFELTIEENSIPLSLLELNTPKNFGVNIILIKRNKKCFMPTSADQLLPNDHIFAFGLYKGIVALDQSLHSKAKGEK